MSDPAQLAQGAAVAAVLDGLWALIRALILKRLPGGDKNGV